MAEERLVSGATPFERLVSPFQAFARIEASGGILLFVCTLAALVWANSPWASSYFHLLHLKLTFGFATAQLSEELHFWINDGLMAVFFLLVGLEIKREVLTGELGSFQKAAMPIAAAIGGMLVPALIYITITHGGTGAAGWGIPMATNIAFALGVLALLGDRVPTPLKVFLVAVAIVDDIGAVLVIAFFYTEKISPPCLGAAAALLGALLLMNWIGARHSLIYVALGVALWLALLQSGVHATIAGILLALTIPTRPRIDGPAFIAGSERILNTIRTAHAAGQSIEASGALHGMMAECERAESPLLRFEHALTPWIKYLVMPVFALANAGVALGGHASGALVSRIGLGVICGLFIGKPAGITAFSWLAARSGFATLPARVTWRQIMGIGMLGGIGFTMALFVANLALETSADMEIAKIGILAASACSTVAGVLMLLQARPPVRKGALQ